MNERAEYEAERAAGLYAQRIATILGEAQGEWLDFFDTYGKYQVRFSDYELYRDTVLRFAKKGEVEFRRIDGRIKFREHQPEAPCHKVWFASRAPERLMW